MGIEFGIRRSFGRFARDERGALTAFTAVCFLLMFGAVGMGVDFMRQETRRAELQAAIDNAVLAAASLREGGEPKVVVKDMLSAAGYDPDAIGLDVQSQVDGATRRVSVSARTQMPTYFLKVVGFGDMDVVASATATETASNLEISLVLDISTSMAIYRTGTNDEMRLDVMKREAVRFLTGLLEGQGRENISVTVVPFAGQVNLGPIARNYFRKKNRHDYTACLEFEPDDFTRFRLPNQRSRDQMVHFSHYDWWNDPEMADIRHVIGYGWCPSDDSRVLYQSNSLEKLTNHINGLKTHEATGSQYGMRWGLGLLHPDTRPLMFRSILAGDTPFRFFRRPVRVGTPGTEKIIVYMSDGDTTGQYRIVDKKYPGGRVRDADLDDPTDLTTIDNVLEMLGPKPRWQDVWALVPAGNVEYSADGQYTDIDGEFMHRTRTVQEARADFANICQVAKDEGITVFTIGFDVQDGSNAETDLAACASSAGHFFDVHGDALGDAFDQIGVSITRLRLTS